MANAASVKPAGSSTTTRRHGGCAHTGLGRERVRRRCSRQRLLPGHRAQSETQTAAGPGLPRRDTPPARRPHNRRGPLARPGPRPRPSPWPRAAHLPGHPAEPHDAQFEVGHGQACARPAAPLPREARGGDAARRASRAGGLGSGLGGRAGRGWAGLRPPLPRARRTCHAPPLPPRAPPRTKPRAGRGADTPPPAAAQPMAGRARHRPARAAAPRPMGSGRVRRRAERQGQRGGGARPGAGPALPPGATSVSREALCGRLRPGRQARGTRALALEPEPRAWRRPRGAASRPGALLMGPVGLGSLQGSLRRPENVPRPQESGQEAWGGDEASVG